MQDKPEGGSVGGKKRRHQRQKLKDRYAHAREDAQLAGLIPTTPEEALKPERVPPSSQSSTPMPELIAQAIRKGWAVDEDMKPHLVQELVDILMSGDTDVKHKIAAFQALRMADRDQHERDNPEKDKGGAGMTVNINVETVTKALPPKEVEAVSAIPVTANGLTSVEVPGAAQRQ